MKRIERLAVRGQFLDHGHCCAGRQNGGVGRLAALRNTIHNHYLTPHVRDAGGVVAPRQV